jgi:hypothetical protein
MMAMSCRWQAGNSSSSGAAADGGQNMNLVRGATQFERLSPGQPTVHIELAGRISEPEIFQCRNEPLRVHRRRADEHIEILAVPGRTVHRHGLAADDQIFDMVPVQTGTEGFEIGLDGARPRRHQVSRSVRSIERKCVRSRDGNGPWTRHRQRIAPASRTATGWSSQNSRRRTS